jgi:hypothetical protein
MYCGPVHGIGRFGNSTEYSLGLEVLDEKSFLVWRQFGPNWLAR